MENNGKLILENGSEYYGILFGSATQKVVEVVFNTSMVGYQEIISDPSYTDQGVVMTYPLIGNYGMADDDYETKEPSIGALIVREYNDLPSNFRSRETLEEVMKKYDIAGIGNLDTRMLTRQIRSFGSMKGLICKADVGKEEGLKILNEAKLPNDAVSRVSTKEIIKSSIKEPKFKVVAIDCGMKENIVRMLNHYGCDVIKVPYDTPYEKITEFEPDGIFISNGPGDPTDVSEVKDTVKKLIGKLPIFGICLGHQILSLAYGAKTYKLKFGHRGGNHPVLNLKTGKIEITSQNHSYAVDKESIEKTPLTITHINILDNTVEGVMCEKDKAFGVQYHPESAPGPEDSKYLFEVFMNFMEENRRA